MKLKIVWVSQRTILGCIRVTLALGSEVLISILHILYLELQGQVTLLSIGPCIMYERPYLPPFLIAFLLSFLGTSDQVLNSRLALRYARGMKDEGLLLSSIPKSIRSGLPQNEAGRPLHPISAVVLLDTDPAALLIPVLYCPLPSQPLPP